MKSRSSFCFIAIFTICHFVPVSSSEDYEVSRTVEPKVLSRLESQFLKLFGMKKRPLKRKSSIKIPRYLVELYESQSGLELPTSNLHLPGRHTKTANTVRTFYPLGQNKLTFDLSSIPIVEEVTGAEIRIPLNTTKLFPILNNSSNLVNYTTNNNNSSPSDIINYKIRVIVNDVVKISSNNEPIMYPVDSKIVDFGKRKLSSLSIMLDVFPAVSRWLSLERQKKRNKGLIIQVFNAYTNEELDWSWDDSDTGESPALFTYSDDGVHSRKTRDAGTLSRQYRSAVQERKRGKKHRAKNRKKNLCARQEMFVDFTDVGWNDWIVAPPGYHAYHCVGECSFPMAEHLNATNHAVIQALVNSMNPQQVPPPCCVPTKYSSLSLLYTDSSDKIVLKNYNEMVVDSCGCS